MKVAVVGAGVVGRLTALSLIKNGIQVSLFDQAPLTATDNACFVSAGMICPISEAAHAHPEVIKLGFESLALWPTVLAHIKTLDPQCATIFYKNNGSLVVASSLEQAGLRQFHFDIETKLQQHDVQINRLDELELQALEPDLNNVARAYQLQPEAQLCNREFLQATTRVLKRHCETIEHRRLFEVDIQNLQSMFDYIIDCRGHGAIDHEFLHANASPLRGVRGEVIRVFCPDVKLQHAVRVIHPRHPIYIAPKANNTFVVGATEVESKSHHPITVRSTLELLTTLYSINPAFAEAQVLESAVGVRSAYLDNAPQVIKADNLISANGLYRHGWLTGPAISQRILNCLYEERS